MASIDGRTTPDFTVDDSRGKGRVLRPTEGSAFSVGDSVYVTTARGRKGPYLIETVVGSGKYTLCDPDGTRYENGAQVENGDLNQAIISEVTS
ncbi:hypothetical protein F4803DRAFT_540516, partial [Xylaria telfairii]